MSHQNRQISNRFQHGFTIVELMIATLVFSVILVVITSGVIKFTNNYYKGVNSSTTQTAARNIIDTVTQAIQFGYTSPTSSGSPVTTYCTNNQQFDFALGKELGGTSSLTRTAYGLKASTASTGCVPQSASGQELLGNRMRLAVFTLTPIDAYGTAYTVHVRVAYGDDDQLCSPGVRVGGVDSCASNQTMSRLSDFQTADLRCKAQTGSQFCSVADYATTVQVRSQPIGAP